MDLRKKRKRDEVKNELGKEKKHIPNGEVLKPLNGVQNGVHEKVKSKKKKKERRRNFEWSKPHQ